MPAANDRRDHGRLGRSFLTTTLGDVCGLVAAAALLLGAPTAFGEQSSDSLSLLPGRPIERTLEAGGTDLFRLDLAG